MVRRRIVDSLFEITNETIQSIKKSIGEDEDKLSHIEELLDQWMQYEPHLPSSYDRKMARNFIRGSKFNLDIVKKKFEGYFLAKYSFPHFYQDRDPNGSDISAAIDAINVVLLPKLTEKGERICVLSLADPDPAVFDMSTAVKLFWMLYDLTLTCEFPIMSEILIFDCTNVTSTHLVKFLSMPFKNSLSIIRDGYAARISQVYLVNCHPIVDKALSAVLPLVHEKVRNRIVTHKDHESLLKDLPTRLLPSNFGGDLYSLRDYMRLWRQMLVENSDWFRDQENVNISGKPPKRVEKFTNDASVEGSFRQLSID